MAKELPKVYDPSEVESRVYEQWETSGCFKGNRDPDKKPFTIVMPPPNVTGQLHMGHAMDATLQDILIRFKRMQGYAALWVPGTDHAGIATQIKVEEDLRVNEGKTRYDLGREKFLERVWAWKNRFGNRIVEQQKKLGASCDWERARFTMDEGCSRAVREVFVSLYEKGLIYRGSRIINWCPNCVTALSDAEVEYVDKPGHLWHMRYPLTDGSGYTMEADKEPDITGAIKTAYQVADALLLQYYEAPDAVTAAFGHELTEDDWAAIGRFMTTCLEMKHGAPLVAENITNPLLQELEAEMKNDQRKFSFFCAHDCTVLGTLSALGAKLDALPDSIETKTPIGVKLMFERLRDKEGQAWYRVSMVYRSTEQIRSAEMLTPDNPPMKYVLSFEGVETNEDGLIAEADLFSLFDRSIAALDELEAEYSLADAA